MADFEYAEIKGGKIIGFRMFPEPLNPAEIRREGASLYVDVLGGSRVAITEAEVGRVIASHRVRVVFRPRPLPHEAITVPVADDFSPAAQAARAALKKREEEIAAGLADEPAPFRDVYLDGVLLPDGLPEGVIVGEVVSIGGLPVLRPVREIKPVFDAATEMLVNAGEEIFDGEVVRTLKAVPRVDPPKPPLHRLVDVLVAKNHLTAEEAAEILK